jgi:hypothetical protein
MNAEAPMAGKKSKGSARGGAWPQNAEVMVKVRKDNASELAQYAGARSERSSTAQRSKVVSCSAFTQKAPASGTQAQNGEFTLE